MTTTDKATALQTKILCTNILNRHKQEITKYETNFFSGLIGVNPFKIDGSFKKKYEGHENISFKYKINAFGFDFWVMTSYYVSTKYKNITLHISTTVTGGGYDKQGVNCNNQQMTAWVDIFKTDAEGVILEPIINEFSNVEYMEDDILKAAEQVKEAAKIYNSALEKVPYQFRDVLYLERLSR